MSNTVSNAEETTVDQPVDQIAQETQAAGLTIQDLIYTMQVLQVVSQRGAFRADELTSVGALYDKLVTFLASTGALQPAPTDGSAETPADTTTETTQND